MSAADVVVLVAAVVACVAAVVALAAAVVLVGQVRRFERGLEALRAETVPLVHEARQAVDQAAAEMARVEAVLEGTESVTATVDVGLPAGPAGVRQPGGEGAGPAGRHGRWPAAAARGRSRRGRPRPARPTGRGGGR